MRYMQYMHNYLKHQPTSKEKEYLKMIDIKGFFTKNQNKKITLAVWFYAAWYRFCIRFISPKKLSLYWGIRGEESAETATMEQYRYAKLVGNRVNRSANHTPWESKCLVRALTAQKLLKRKKIESTLYLGVGQEDGKMTAHAWLRVGQMYVTGGNGEGYAIVDKYRA